MHKGNTEYFKGATDWTYSALGLIKIARVGFSISADVAPPRPWWRVELLSLSSIFLGLEKELYSFSIYKNLRGNLPTSWNQAFTGCSWFRERIMFFLYISRYQGTPWISLALNKSSPWKKEKKSLLKNTNYLAYGDRK